MRKIVDIRPIKRELRAKYRRIRERMNAGQKKEWDHMIFCRLVEAPFYKRAKTLFCFVSTAIEVDTIAILKQAFADNKTVAVPKCMDRNGHMEFFIIHSLDELREDMFGLLEPDPAQCEKATDFTDALCILPAFAFDTEGVRIGFGKGYYDRFLQRFSGVKAGICYNNCMTSSLPHGRYDVPADFVVTPKYILTVKKQEEQSHD